MKAATTPFYPASTPFIQSLKDDGLDPSTFLSDGIWFDHHDNLHYRRLLFNADGTVARTVAGPVTREVVVDKAKIPKTYDTYIMGVR